MIYKITRYNIANDNLSFILIDSDYNKDDIASLISAYQFLTEALFDSKEVRISLTCLEKILCGYYHIDNVYSDFQKYLPFKKKDGWFEANGFYIDKEDVFVCFVDFERAVNKCRENYCEHMEKFLYEEPEIADKIRQLILKEGIEK